MIDQRNVIAFVLNDRCVHLFSVLCRTEACSQTFENARFPKLRIPV